jgi:hypothetical protein
MVILAMLSFPTESANEVGKRFLALKPMPDYVKIKGPYVTNTKGEGVQTVTLFEFEQSKLADVYKLANDRYANFYGVPDFTCSIQVWLEVTEALKLVGLA